MIDRPYQYPFRLRRIARSAFARLLARALALLMIFGNVAAAGMPMGSNAMGTDVIHHGAPHAMAQMHHHCDAGSAAASTPQQKMPHGSACPCCAGSACACLHLSANGVMLVLIGLPTFKTTPAPPLYTSALAEVALAERLRPPIV